MSRVEFGDRRARRRFVQSMRGERSLARPRSVGSVVFLTILLLAMHARPSGGYLPHSVVVSNEGSPRERQPTQHSREVHDMGVRTMIGVVAVAALGSSSMAAELLVPEQYPTIQAALAACAPQDVVSVASGTYNVGLITMPAIPVTLRGRGSQSATVIQGEAIQIFSGSGPRTIESLTLRGMTGYGAIHVDGAAAIVRDVTIETSYFGIFLNTNASAEKIRCTFRQNLKGGYAYVNSFWSAIDCLFEGGNSGGSYGGAAGFHIGSGCSFLRCRFVSNYASQGGAIGLSFSGARLFDQCYFEDNTAADGNVWWTEFGATGTLKNSVLCGHSTADFSGSWIDGGGNQFFPKGCTPPCPADLVDDNAVNGADLAIILVAWGTNGSQYPGADLDGNGVVNGPDLATVLAAWGPCPH